MSPPAPHPSSRASAGTGSRLLGRGAELELIEQLGRGALDADGGTLLVSAPLGVGKTSLLTAARSALEDLGLRVVQARGTTLEQPYGYGGVRQLLDHVLRRLGDDEQVWAGPASFARPIFEDLASDDSADAAASTFVRLQGLYWLLAQVVDRVGPLALVVDDAQWLDERTLQFLTHLAIRLDGLPVVLLVGTRPSAGLPPDAALHDLEAVVPVRKLAPLTTDDIAALVFERWPAAPVALPAELHRVTGGVPLLLDELLGERRRAGNDEPPEADELGDLGVATIAARIQRELRGADPATVGLAHAAAILGDDVPITVLLALAGVAPARHEALQPLLDAALLRDDHGQIGFVHAVVQNSVLGSIPSARRGAMHRQAASILRDADPADRRIEGHLLHSPPAGERWAAEALRLAARRAVTVGSLAEAAALLERALLELPDSPADLRLELARALTNAGRHEGLDHFRAALDQADPQERFAVARDYAGALMLAGRTNAAFDLVYDLIAGPDGTVPPAASPGLHGLALIARSEQAQQFRATQLATPPATPAADHAAILAYELMVRGHPNAELQPLLDVAFATDSLMPDMATSPAFGFGILTLIATDRYAMAETQQHRLLTQARAAGAPMLEAFIECGRAFRLARVGRLAEAEDSVASSLAHADEPTWQFARVNAALLLADFLPLRGRTAEARAALEGLTPSDVATESVVAELFEHSRAIVLLAEGQPSAALETLRGIGERLDAWQLISPALCWWRSTASTALVALGELDQARELAQTELHIAEHTGILSTMARARTALALATDTPDLAALTRAAEEARRAGVPLLEIQARHALGRGLAQAGDHEAARTTLREAHIQSERTGAHQLTAEIVADLSAAGGRPRRQSVAGPAGLTPSEARVARLAAEGATNREIAQRLYLSQKTVEMHLRNVYRKLEVPGRAHLATALGGGAERDELTAQP